MAYFLKSCAYIYWRTFKLCHERHFA